MMTVASFVSYLTLAAALLGAAASGAQGQPLGIPLSPRGSDTKPVWLTLPETPSLPSPINSARTAIGGVELWIQKYNEKPGQTPLVLDHGGLGHSAYFGAVLSRLIAKGRYVIALDRRGHGRSTFLPGDVFTYDLFANDIYAQLKASGVGKYNVVGWSDGAITTLSALLNSTISPTIGKAFLFGASRNPSDTNASFAETDVFAQFVSRCRLEYGQLQPQANFTMFANKVATLEAKLPQFSKAQLGQISDGSRVRIAAAQYEEAVELEVPAKLQAAIKGSSLVTLANVSHFAPLQDPDQFTKAVEDFFFA